MTSLLNMRRFYLRGVSMHLHSRILQTGLKTPKKKKIIILLWSFWWRFTCRVFFEKMIQVYSSSLHWSLNPYFKCETELTHDNCSLVSITQSIFSKHLHGLVWNRLYSSFDSGCKSNSFISAVNYTVCCLKEYNLFTSLLSKSSQK